MSEKCVYNTTFGTVKFELMTNGNKNSYQTLKLSNDNNNFKVDVAPVDYFVVINALVFAKDLKEFVVMVRDIWTISELSGAIRSIFDLGWEDLNPIQNLL